MKKVISGSIIFLAGILTVGGVNGVFDSTNETEFCVSCHTMQWNLEEYKQTVHYQNASGVRAECADCHVPKEFFPKVYAKLVAARDVWHQFAGTIDTKEDFEARRWHLANRVWERMEANDSRECRTCHEFEQMELSEQGSMASSKHARAREEGKTCINCHQGIAHNEPDIPLDEIDLDDIQL